MLLKLLLQFSTRKLRFTQEFRANQIKNTWNCLYEILMLVVCSNRSSIVECNVCSAIARLGKHIMRQRFDFRGSENIYKVQLSLSTLRSNLFLLHRSDCETRIVMNYCVNPSFLRRTSGLTSCKRKVVVITATILKTYKREKKRHSLIVYGRAHKLSEFKKFENIKEYLLV